VNFRIVASSITKSHLWLREATSEDFVIMKVKLPIIILGALLIMANSADAQHRTRGHGYSDTP
jgi:hypothetical protein